MGTFARPLSRLGFGAHAVPCGCVRWRDYAHGNKKRKMTLLAEEFMRRSLMHVLPRGFVRIRYFGWMSNRHPTALAAVCRALLGAEPAPARPRDEGSGRVCPFCGGAAMTVETFTPLRLLLLHSRPHAVDTL